jgi:hypothetical protein
VCGFLVEISVISRQPSVIRRKNCRLTTDDCFRGISLAQRPGKGEKLMITFRKHALAETQRFDSRLMHRRRGARAVPRIVAMLGIIFATGAVCAASQGQNEAVAGPPAAADERKREPKVPARDYVEATEVDVKVYVAGTPEDPYILARIGDFPEDLGELGQEFLKREFIEHFIRDVMGLSGQGRAGALKIALLPQADAREQECSFNNGEVSGQITVRLAERHVFVLVSLDHEKPAAPTLRAALEKVSSFGWRVSS